MLMNTYKSVIRSLVKFYQIVKIVNHYKILYLIIKKLYCPDCL